MFSQAHHQPRQRQFDFARRTLSGASDAHRSGWVGRTEAVLGTAVTVELWAEDARSGAASCAAALDEVRRIDRLASAQRPGSELARINREAVHHAVPLSEEMFHLVARAIECSRLTAGAFDLGRGGPRRPDGTAAGWRQLLLDTRAHTLRFTHPELRIDLGALAAAHAADSAATLLVRRGIRHAAVGVGRQARLVGDRRGRPWNVALCGPHGDEPVARLSLADISIASAGEFECSWAGCGDGRDARPAHPPAERRGAGQAPAGLCSVTVLAADGVAGAALCQAMRTLGAERGLALIEPLAGTGALIVDAGARLHASAGLSGAVCERRSA